LRGKARSTERLDKSSVPRPAGFRDLRIQSKAVAGKSQPDLAGENGLRSSRARPFFFDNNFETPENSGILCPHASM
jgi:hypothetical protein